MQKKLLIAFAVVALVAAMTFGEADACRRCNYDHCSGCNGAGVISIQPIVPSYSACHGCGGLYNGPSYLPRHYCNSCLGRKSYRLADHCSCGC